MAKKNDEQVLRCSFCGKAQDEVKKLIAGPMVYICDECVGLCNEIIDEDTQSAVRGESKKLPTPMEIKKFLDDYVIGQEMAKRSCRLRFITITSAFIKGRNPMSSCRRAIFC